jgi:signal transduction histidine kinase
MIGMDPNWVNADKRRTAFFPYLPPGSYTFEVIAISPDGIPSGGPATVRIEVPGRFWESIWFVILVACLAVLIIYLVFRMRFSQLAEKERLQAEFSGALINAQEKERMRIAEDLHDGLGQQLLLIQNWTALAQNPELPNEKQAAYLEEISLSTADALAETRSAVQALAPQNLERFGLTETIISMVDQMANASGIRIEREVEDIDAIVPKRDQLGVFRIVQECLTNVVKHSKASKASVTVSRSQTKLFIEVEDNGIGLSSEPGSKVGGGFGLQGIRERLRLLNGRIEIVSSPSSGTKIRILIEYEANNEDPNS